MEQTSRIQRAHYVSVSREEKTRGFVCSRKDAKFSNLEEGCGQSLLGTFLMGILKNIQ